MSEEIQIPTAWIESGKQGETLYNKKALRHACNQTLDAFVAECEKISAEHGFNRIVNLEQMKQIAQRMKGEGS